MADIRVIKKTFGSPFFIPKPIIAANTHTQGKRVGLKEG